MTHIHPMALVNPDANIGKNVTIGPFSIVEAGVTIGDDSRIAGHVVVKTGTTLGKKTEVFEGSVLGGVPQHLGAGNKLGTLEIGDGNLIREYVTIHRGLRPGDATSVGSGNLIMVNTHIGHDCVIGNHTIIANNAMLAGHVEIQDHAYLSGGVGVHQFSRVGRHAMVGGQAHIVQDVPPYVTVDGASSMVVGINRIGLRRRGFTQAEMGEIKEVYHIIYRTDLVWADVLKSLANGAADGAARVMHEFLSSGKRGIVQERRRTSNSTVKIKPSDSPKIAPDTVRKAG